MTDTQNNQQLFNSSNNYSLVQPASSLQLPESLVYSLFGFILAFKDFQNRCRTPVGQMIIFGKDPAGGNKLVS
jgi:hypothetical protein